MQLAADEDFAVFVRARQQALVRAAYLVCGDHHAAQDLVQGSLAKLAARWEQVRDGSPEAYVRRIVYRDAISRWRRTRRENPYDAGSRELVRLAGADDRDPAQEWVAGRTSVSRWPSCLHASVRWSCCATTRICPSPRSPRSWGSARARSRARHTRRCATCASCCPTWRRR